MALNKVLFINYSYAYGSTGRLVQDIGAALEKQGIETYYACKKATAHHKNLYMIGSKFVHLCAGLHSRVSGLQGYSCTAATQALITFMDQLKPDVIHLHNLHGNYINIHILFRWLSKQNCKIVWTLHDCWPLPVIVHILILLTEATVTSGKMELPAKNARIYTGILPVGFLIAAIKCSGIKLHFIPFLNYIS